MRRQRLAPLLLLLMTATCAREDMFDQQREAPWSRSAFFSDHMSMRRPVAGTVARDAPDEAVAQPPLITEAMLARGQQRFGIDCVPCHGQAGDGWGMIVERGFPRPPSLFSDDLIKARAQHFYDVISHGHGVMYSYADRVSPADRWAITAYIRALQRSQRAQVASLPAQDQHDLRAAEP